MKDNIQEAWVDVETAIVTYEAQLSEFGHEIVDPSARCANHFREHSLRYFWQHLLGFFLQAVPSELQKSTRQPFLTGIEEVVDQILLRADVP